MRIEKQDAAVPKEVLQGLICQQGHTPAKFLITFFPFFFYSGRDASHPQICFRIHSPELVYTIVNPIAFLLDLRNRYSPLRPPIRFHCCLRDLVGVGTGIYLYTWEIILFGPGSPLVRMSILMVARLRCRLSYVSSITSGPPLASDGLCTGF
jgi:hypothetical protein